mmetsp:Transcript_26336/g.45303  ORF Transcript_26336/g.45303 Transcript_26336/m.45303 type:complete len:132 (+) Transcript_26336:145-540(+)|eukprot:CAMPEP_0196651896 /NCGR_PEP_ID=MMETSP1086-20130531/1081_1 /TAXON_ID=77921 /ORGANISM="Cyanoptyche  gloeocystis , Strain SAG4.97" /LENGTH=131 /DNA_ID=CAMNT_0041982191 /DNA_START=139 /DNA_END=534 /DNA_ORIENTATION=+
MAPAFVVAVPIVSSFNGSSASVSSRASSPVVLKNSFVGSKLAAPSVVFRASNAASFEVSCEQKAFDVTKMAGLVATAMMAAPKAANAVDFSSSLVLAEAGFDYTLILTAFFIVSSLAATVYIVNAMIKGSL